MYRLKKRGGGLIENHIQKRAHSLISTTGAKNTTWASIASVGIDLARPRQLSFENALRSPSIGSWYFRIRAHAPMAMPPSTVKVWPVIYAALSSVAMNLSSRDSSGGHASEPQPEAVGEGLAMQAAPTRSARERESLWTWIVPVQSENHTQGFKRGYPPTLTLAASLHPRSTQEQGTTLRLEHSRIEYCAIADKTKKTKQAVATTTRYGPLPAPRNPGLTEDVML